MSDKQKDPPLLELENVYLDMKQSSSLANIKTVKGKYKYYHYKCDGYSDVGWGCGYRTTQMMCSWIRNQLINEAKSTSSNKIVAEVPSILEMQKILVDCGDKEAKFVGSKDWIGCFESCIIIDSLYDVPCKIVHCSPDQIGQHVEGIKAHLEQFGSPIGVGGDLDNASKGIIGAGCASNSETCFLITDPHFTSNKPASKHELFDGEWIKWASSASFKNGSFYNFCLPQKKAFPI